MKRKLKELLNRILNGETKPPPEIIPNLLDMFYGHHATKKLQQSLNLFGEPIPWFSYPAIDYLKQFDLRDKTVFEWGSGNSSLFFAERAKKVTSVEHDTEWFELVNKTKKENQILIYKPLTEYPKSIHDTDDTYDMIVIDGQRRFDCTIECVEKLKENGMIILDNSDWFYKSASFLKKEMNMIQFDFHGFSPINEYVLTTSVFLKRDFDFPVKNNRMPNNPYGGILHDEFKIMEDEDKIYNTKNVETVTKLSL